MSVKTSNIDAENFCKINDKVKAYILGLLWADGNISYDKIVNFCSTLPDADTFLTFFNHIGKWNVYSYKNKKHPTWKVTAKISTSNKDVINFLIKNDFKVRFGGFKKILKTIPNKFHRYWLLGFIDGDGCFHINKKNGSYRFSIASCYEQTWTDIEKILKNLKIEYKIERYKGLKSSYSKIHIVGKSRVKKFGDYLYITYNEDELGLYRKWDKYKQISNQCNKWVRKCTLS